MTKSPGFVRLNNEIAIIMNEVGDDERAFKELDNSIENSNERSALYFVNKARFLLGKGRLGEARSVILEVSSDKENLNVEILKVLALIDEKRLYTSLDKEQKTTLVRELAETYRYIYHKSGEPITLYRAGQLLLSLGDYTEAQKLFQKSYEVAPADAYFREAAHKLSVRLGKTKS